MPGFVLGSVPGFVPGSVPGFVPGSVPGFVLGSVPGFVPESVPGLVPVPVPKSTSGSVTIALPLTTIDTVLGVLVAPFSSVTVKTKETVCDCPSANPSNSAPALKLKLPSLSSETLP